MLMKSSKCAGELICFDFDGSCFNFYCASVGWCAIGVSSTGLMPGLDIYWFSELGMLNLEGKGHVQPSLKEVITTVTPILDNSPPWAKLTKSFCPNKVQNNKLNSNGKFVFAISNTRPVGTQLETVAFQKHDFHGELLVVQGSATGSATGSLPGAGSNSTTKAMTSPTSTPQSFATRSNAYYSLIMITVLACL